MIIFNNAINNHYFPQSWKTTLVAPIYKKDKDPMDPSSYRPISLLPNISKVLEIIICKHIDIFCTEKEIIPEQQFGFRHKNSAVHAIVKLTSDLCWNLKKNLIGACLIDLQKAFDSICIEGLIFKLINYSFEKNLITTIYNMITNRNYRIIKNG